MNSSQVFTMGMLFATALACHAEEPTDSPAALRDALADIERHVATIDRGTHGAFYREISEIRRSLQRIAGYSRRPRYPADSVEQSLPLTRKAMKASSERRLAEAMSDHPGERAFASAVRSMMHVDYTVQDAALFDSEFIHQIMDVLFAKDQIDWDVFDKQRQLSNYHCDDVRPDKVFEKFIKKEAGSDQVRAHRSKLAVDGGGGFGPFKVTLATDQDKNDFLSHAQQVGIHGEWVGEEFRPKKLQVTQINDAKLQGLRSFTMVTRSVVNATFAEPITLELNNYRGPSVLEIERVKADEDLRRLIEMHAADRLGLERDHQSVLEGTRQEYELALTRLRERISALESPGRRKQAINQQMSLRGCWSFDTRVKEKLTELLTEKYDVEVRVTSHVEVSRTASVERADVVVSYVAQRLDKRSGQQLPTQIEGTARHTVYTAPAGKRILSIHGGTFDSGSIRYGDSHRKRSADGDGPGLYGFHAVPLNHDACWKELSVCFDESYSKACEWAHYGVQGTIQFAVEVEK